jgi:hypothetical protein
MPRAALPALSAGAVLTVSLPAVMRPCSPLAALRAARKPEPRTVTPPVRAAALTCVRCARDSPRYSPQPVDGRQHVEVQTLEVLEEPRDKPDERERHTGAAVARWRAL